MVSGQRHEIGGSTRNFHFYSRITVYIVAWQQMTDRKCKMLIIGKWVLAAHAAGLYVSYVVLAAGFLFGVYMVLAAGLSEKRAGLNASRAFVRFACVTFCHFLFVLGVGGWLCL